MSNTVEAKLGKAALIPSIAIGLIGLVFSTLAKGKPGFYGALLAQVVVVIFFAVHLFVSKYSKIMDPIAVMVFAMLSFFIKVVILGVVFLVVLANVGTETLNRTCFGIVAIAVIVAWLTGEVRAFFSIRVQMPLPKKTQE